MGVVTSHHVRVHRVSGDVELQPRPDLRLLDVGSGGGVPGIPIAIVRPEWRVTLVDPNHKKVTFLTQAAIELRLRNVDAQRHLVVMAPPAAAEGDA